MLPPARSRFIFGSAHALLETLSESADDTHPGRAGADRRVRRADAAGRVAGACRLTGRSRATHYRRRLPPVVSRPLRPKTPPPSTLSAAERRAVLEVLHRDEYAEMSVAQVWARGLDQGRHWCSQSTIYRILREAGEGRKRHR